MYVTYQVRCFAAPPRNPDLSQSLRECPAGTCALHRLRRDEAPKLRTLRRHTVCTIRAEVTQESVTAPLSLFRDLALTQTRPVEYGTL